LLSYWFNHIVIVNKNGEIEIFSPWIIRSAMEVKMKRKMFFLAVGAVLLLSLLACVFQSGPKFAPPPMREEVMSAQPGSHFVWIPGHWGWRNHEYVWTNGYWVTPRAGHNWVSGRWMKHGRHWKWNPGHWQ
jgi:hypothetical protein